MPDTLDDMSGAHDGFFLARAGNLTIDDLFEYPTPDRLLEDLGYTIVWSRIASLPLRPTFDYLIHDEDQNWYAIRIGDYSAAGGSTVYWVDKPFRLVLLYAALTRPFAGPCPSVGDVAQALTSEHPNGFADPVRGDNRPSGVLLCAALDLLEEEERAAHETLIALKKPNLLGDLTQLRNWMVNITDDQWHPDALAELAAATQRIWPALGSPGWVPDEHMSKMLLCHPRTGWTQAAEDLLREEALTEGSLVFDMLALQWSQNPRNRDEFTHEVLDALTTPKNTSAAMTT